MSEALSDAVGRLTGAKVTGLRPLQGGDLSSVSRVTLDDGRTVIAKSGPEAQAEAGMLRAIRATGCLCPEVVADAPGLLLMTELTDGGGPSHAAWVACGAAVAQLHAATGDAYGWTADHAFGPVPIRNAPMDNWPGFWAERRLLADVGALPLDLARRLERLSHRLTGLLPATPPSALLHGDLWSGNVLWGPQGFSGVIDPACYHGHAEVDLAMLSLFGRIGDGFFEGYGTPETELQERRPLYQLWPALVHLRLFGSGYRGLMDRLLTAVGA